MKAMEEEAAEAFQAVQDRKAELDAMKGQADSVQTEVRSGGQGEGVGGEGGGC